MLAVMLASFAANEKEGESTRRVGGVNLQLSKLFQPPRVKTSARTKISGRN